MDSSQLIVSKSGSPPFSSLLALPTDSTTAFSIPWAKISVAPRRLDSTLSLVVRMPAALSHFELRFFVTLS